LGAMRAPGRGEERKPLEVGVKGKKESACSSTGTQGEGGEELFQAVEGGPTTSRGTKARRFVVEEGKIAKTDGGGVARGGDRHNTRLREVKRERAG